MLHTLIMCTIVLLVLFLLQQDYIKTTWTQANKTENPRIKMIQICYKINDETNFTLHALHAH